MNLEGSDCSDTYRSIKLPDIENMLIICIVRQDQYEQTLMLFF